MRNEAFEPRNLPAPQLKSLQSQRSLVTPEFSLFFNVMNDNFGLRFLRLIFLIIILVRFSCLVAAEESAASITKTKRFFTLLTLLPYSSNYSFSDPSWNAGDDLQPALNLAVDQINERSDILCNFTLQLVHKRDGCDLPLTDITLSNFAEAISERHVQQVAEGSSPMAGTIGPSCSASTEELFNLSGRPEIKMVSVHDAANPEFENRSKYPYLIGVLGSTRSFIQGFLELLRRSKWTKIAILFDDTREYFISTKKFFLKELKEFNKNNVKKVSAEVIPVSQVYIPLEYVERKLLRVIFVLTTISLTRSVMCRATDLKMSNGRYQYVLMSSRLGDFAKNITLDYNKQKRTCTFEELKNGVLNRSLLLTYNLLPKSNIRLLSNMNYSEYLREYKSYRKNYTAVTGRSSKESNWATNLYDAVWAWAIVLDKLTKENCSFEIKYGDEETSEKIVKHFFDISFEGMAGEVSFDNATGFIRREVVVSQLMDCGTYPVIIIGPDGKKRRNGLFRTDEYGENSCNVTYISNDHLIGFINDSFEIIYMREHQGLGVTFLLIALTELILVIVLHAATLVKRRSASVKASSFKLLNISYVGTYILIVGILLWALFSAAPSINSHYQNYFCQLLWAWTIPIGFALSFCPVVLKTWRLYRIFEHYMNPGHFIATPYLIAGIIVVTALNIVLSVSWTALDTYSTNCTHAYSADETSEILFTYCHCICKHEGYWLGTLAVLLMLLVLVGTALAVLTRKINNDTFATSSLRVLVYLMSLVTLVGAVIYGISVALKKENELSSLSYTTLLAVLTTVVCLLIVLVLFPPLHPEIKKNGKSFKPQKSSLKRPIL